MSEEYEKIWSTIEPHMKSIITFMDPFMDNTPVDDGGKEHGRLWNIRNQFARGIMIAESSKYLPLQDKPRFEGYDFNKPAIEYCACRFYSIAVSYMRKNRSEEEFNNLVYETAIRYINLGILPEINDTAMKVYLNDANLLPPLAEFINDKTIDFDSPAKKAVKGFFGGLFG